ncbi:alpha/beta hydrolase [Bradyrhizobium sp. dw_78]|uniref:alpha/beta fold hydrolase n=1 Tax=Bradyrhizobium sp. dw_78 TaxID=2719793 RepID=UPI00201B9F00|nr:alpha/beta hydrolase [Bradyrhizobium sp. dw_78]
MMRNASFGRRFWPALAILAGMAGWCDAASAQTTKNVILVHGAWADGSSWSKVIPLLDAKGFNVVAVQLPLTSLADDAATVKRAIALENGPVLLVGHSYGGAVITEAGDDPKVKGLVYVAAFAPDAGQSAGSLSGSVPVPLNDQVRPDANGFLKLTKAGVYDDFAQDLSTQEKEVLFAAEAPTSVNALGGKIGDPAWRHKPSWYIVAANDRAISPKLERTMAQTIHATTSVLLHTSHVAMLAQPQEVAGVIEQAEAAVERAASK